MIDLIKQYNNYIRNNIIESDGDIRVCKDILCAIKRSANMYADIINKRQYSSRYVAHPDVIGGYYYAYNGLFIKNENNKINDCGQYIDLSKVIYGNMTCQLLDKFNIIYIKNKSYIAFDSARNRRIYYPTLLDYLILEKGITDSIYVEHITYHIKMKIQPID